MTDTLKRDVERAVDRLNGLAERLGLDRRFELEAGNHSMGRQHRLLEHHPANSGNGPISAKPIGPTYRIAREYLDAMAHAFEAVATDRKWRHDAIVGGAPGGDPFGTGQSDAERVTRAGFVDPDARSVVRSGETHLS